MGDDQTIEVGHVVKWNLKFGDKNLHIVHAKKSLWDVKSYGDLELSNVSSNIPSVASNKWRRAYYDVSEDKTFLNDMQQKTDNNRERGFYGLASADLFISLCNQF
jgi:hypothetical protein